MSTCMTHIRLVCIACAMLLGVHALQAQTPSNDCSTAAAQQITVGSSCNPVTFNINTTIGTPALTSCNGGTATGQDGWAWFTATTTTSIVSYTNTNRDAVIYVYSGTCGSLTLVGCADNVLGTGTETLTISTTIGQTYFVRIVRYSGTSSSMSGNICVYGVTAPSNDACANAIPITCGSTVTGTTIGATPESVPSSCYDDNSTGSVWYSMVGTGAIVTASLCTGTTYDSQISVFTGTCGAFSCANFNDDFCGVQSEVTFSTVSGTTYYIRVNGFLDQGPFTLTTTCVAPPPNDPCSGAIPIHCGDTVNGDTTNGSTETVP